MDVSLLFSRVDHQSARGTRGNFDGERHGDRGGYHRTGKVAVSRVNIIRRVRGTRDQSYALSQ